MLGAVASPRHRLRARGLHEVPANLAPQAGRVRPLNPGQVKMASLMPEDALQGHVATLCKGLHVKHWHHRLSKGTEPGWPDSFMVGPGGILVRELKREDRSKGKVTAAQQECLDLMGLHGLDVGVWRPSDLFSGRIEDEILSISGRRKRA